MNSSTASPSRLGIGEAINRVIEPFGFQIVRTRLQQPERVDGAIEAVRVGKFILQIPRCSPLSRIFITNPHYSGELGRLVSALARHYPGAGMIDVGANVGDTAAIAKSAADIPVLCIEGDPTCFELLRKNVNQFDDVVAMQAFLGEHAESFNARLDKEGWNTTILPGDSTAGHFKNISTVPLDVLLDDFDGGRSYKLLKTDCEGYDTRIIRGARRYIGSQRPVIYLEYSQENMGAIGEDGYSTLMALELWGYDQVLFYEPFGRLILAASLSDKALIRHLHEFISGQTDSVKYYDLCLFHRDDAKLASEFVRDEVAFRKSLDSAGS